MADQVFLIATGLDFVGKGIRSVEGVLDELMESAETSIQLAAYRFDHSFIPMLLHLRDRAEQGLQVTVIINNVGDQDGRVQKTLREIEGTVKVVDFVKNRRSKHEILHAKVVVVDGKRAIIGSANFTFGGLTRNAEIGVYLEGSVAWTLSHTLAGLAHT